jgi:hypothetical protein
MWKPASGMQSKSTHKTLWRCWNDENPSGHKELRNAVGRTWFAYSQEAAQRQCNKLNDENSQKRNNMSPISLGDV